MLQILTMQHIFLLDFKIARIGNLDFYNKYYIFAMKNLSSDFIKKYPFLTLFSTIVFVCVLFWTIQLATNTRVVVLFKDLRPFHYHAPVYFKGFKIGRVIKVAPTGNYQNTAVTILIHPKMKLPANTTAKLKVHKTRWAHKDYIDLLYPESPDLAYLKNNSVIKGENSIDIHSYLANISPETYEQMEENAAAILQNLNDTTGMLFSVFSIINNILSDAETDLKNTAGNFASTSRSTSRIAGKIDNAISQQQLVDTLSNVQAATFNANVAAKGLASTTIAASQSVPNINATLEGVNSVVANVDEITCGLKYTLRKKFGGLRLIFGRTIPSNCTCK